MLSAISSPLVAGSVAPVMETRYIRVLRAFYIGRDVQPVGAIIEVPRNEAASYIAAGKAVATEKPAPVIAEPLPVLDEPAADVDPAPVKRGKKHVG